MPADLRQALATCAASLVYAVATLFMHAPGPYYPMLAQLRKDAVSHLAVNALTTRSFAEYVVLSRDVGGTQKKFTLTS